MRAVSTVLDVTLFLLLVGAAAATLVWIPAEAAVESGDPADETAEVLATTTSQVTYTIEPGVDPEWAADDAGTEFDPFERTVQDSVANLLGAAAVATADVDDEPLMHHGDVFERRVVAATESRIRQENVTTAVRARWTPYPDAPISGTVRAGERPPPAVDVHAASVTVESGVANVSRPARRAAREEGFAGLAEVLANATMEGYLPRTETRLSLRGDYPSVNLTRARYRQVAGAVDVDVVASEGGNTTIDRSAIERAFADRFESDLGELYDDPVVAAGDVRIDRVTVTVRTWSR